LLLFFKKELRSFSLDYSVSTRVLSSPISAVVTFCAMRPRAIVLAFAWLGIISAGYSAAELRITTDLRLLFSPDLAWTQRDAADRAAFPQFQDLIVAVVDAPIPEEAEATAAVLADKLGADHAHFLSVSRPDASPYLRKEGLLFLPTGTLASLLDRTVDAEPFLGQLATDASARGLFGALGLVGVGVARGQANLDSFAPALRAFHATLSAAAQGHAKPLSWESLLAGAAAKLAGPDRIVLVKPRLNYGAFQPGGSATAALKADAGTLEFVKSGDAHVKLTGTVPLGDEEFSSAAKGAVLGLVLTFALIVLWLYLALGSWRLILPAAATLLLGLALTTAFAAVSVGTLNLISVAFAILFVGIAVDFAIQFAVRFRDIRRGEATIEAALALTGARVGRQVLVASGATASGFLAFVPTDFRGMAELGQIAGVGMLIAFACAVTFLPAMLTLCRPRQDEEEIGFQWAAPADRVMVRLRVPVVMASAILFIAGACLVPSLAFDSNTLHTKRQDSEAVRTLMRLLNNPVTNPFTIDVLRQNTQAAQALAASMSRLALVDHVVTVDSFVPADQAAKLALIKDASGLLQPALSPAPVAPPSITDIRQALAACLAKLQPALTRLPAGDPLAGIAQDLRALQASSDVTLMQAAEALVRFLPGELDRLRLALSAGPVSSADVPADIRRDYVLPDGRARIVVVPKSTVSDGHILDRFVQEALAVAPDASGPAITIVSTARTIIGAFEKAAALAVIAISAILLIALGSALDAALVMSPLLLSAAITVLIMRAFGTVLNYANIIAMPLLLGVGVSFSIYFVMNFRLGQAPRLTSATTRATVLSALTTGTAFASLAISAHPGTATMGKLLLIGLASTLLATLVFLPALLGMLGDRSSQGKPKLD
jgi:hopanoid biosynthesis associated RND transporter like protein HpnN